MIVRVRNSPATKSSDQCRNPQTEGIEKAKRRRHRSNRSGQPAGRGDRAAHQASADDNRPPRSATAAAWARFSAPSFSAKPKWFRRSTRSSKTPDSKLPPKRYRTCATDMMRSRFLVWTSRPAGLRTWIHTRKSGILFGVGDDAEHVVSRILDSTRTLQPAMAS